MLPPPITSRLIRFGTFQVDPKSRELYSQGRRIRLQQQPFLILSLLLDHPGEVVTREELRAALWPRDTFVDFDQGLNKAINKIHRALGDSAEHSRYIETLNKCGYRLLVAVNLPGKKSRLVNQAGGTVPRATINNTLGNKLPAMPESRAMTVPRAATAFRRVLAIFGLRKQLSNEFH